MLSRLLNSWNMYLHTAGRNVQRHNHLENIERDLNINPPYNTAIPLLSVHTRDHKLMFSHKCSIL